ncbi:CheW protein [Methylorubrum populi]|uniref:CheW protein n=1 Tax=Methylorubrum populi TaxID=223967 RepID=A0A160PG66_9HYPH|nr:chemotaxis protein CheW [Methylorubrum populi]BAU91734.1 CheW protein [Methylorubrum populi]
MKIGLTAGADPKARHAALLDARAVALAARGAEQEKTVETVAYLVCACGRERYGLPLAAVAGVAPERPCTGLPGAPPALKGITAVAGAIVSVLDLAACLGLDRAGEEDGGHVVRLRAQEPPIALSVDRVIGIARIDVALAQPMNQPESLGRGPLSGYAPPGSDRTGDIHEGFSLVDLPALLARFST